MFLINKSKNKETRSDKSACANIFLEPPLTHSAREYFEKLALKKAKNVTLNGCISKVSANSESKLAFSGSSFRFLQNSVAFCTLCPHGYKARPPPTSPGATARCSPC